MFSDETEVESFFNINVFDISQSEPRLVRVSRSSNEKFFAFKMFEYCDLKTQERSIFPEEVSFVKRNPKLRLDLQSQKTIALLVTIKTSMNII